MRHCQGLVKVESEDLPVPCPVVDHAVRQAAGFHEVEQGEEQGGPEDRRPGPAAAADGRVQGPAEEGLLQDGDQQAAEEGLDRLGRQPVQGRGVRDPHPQGHQGQGQQGQDGEPRQPADPQGAQELPPAAPR